MRRTVSMPYRSPTKSILRPLEHPHETVMPLRKSPARTDLTFPQSQRHIQKVAPFLDVSRYSTVNRPYRCPVKSMNFGICYLPN